MDLHNLVTLVQLTLFPIAYPVQSRHNRRMKLERKHSIFATSFIVCVGMIVFVLCGFAIRLCEGVHDYVYNTLCMAMLFVTTSYIKFDLPRGTYVFLRNCICYFNIS